jgi:hypothetical protein
MLGEGGDIGPYASTRQHNDFKVIMATGKYLNGNLLLLRTWLQT